MKNEENEPFLYQPRSPTAPPMFTNARVVQPFEIAATAYPVADGDSIQHSRQEHRISVILTSGQEESRILDQKIDRGNDDGAAIIRNDQASVMYSNSSGQMQHQKIERKIESSNNDYVHELGASLADVQYENKLINNPVASGATIASGKGDYQLSSESEAKKSSGGKYEGLEYKSMYETEGGYKCEEYKSMYD